MDMKNDVSIALSVVFLVTLLLMGGCGPSEDHAADAKPPVTTPAAGVVRLTADEASTDRTGIFPGPSRLISTPWRKYRHWSGAV